MKKLSQIEFVKAWFRRNPNRDIPHRESKKELEVTWMALTDKRFEDADRAMRKLASEGFLKKVGKGVYRYDPEDEHKRVLHDFTEADKKIILKRDGYRCVICGKGKADGVELHVDHIKPKDLGGTTVITNGQVLCGQHNYFKKISSQTETGKKFFIRLLESIKADQDSNPNKDDYIVFCTDLLEVFEKHGINGHIEWDRKK